MHLRSLIVVLFALVSVSALALAADKSRRPPGPNGGRVITAVKPAVELKITAERRVEITVLDDMLKPAPLSGQSVTIYAGERANPTKLEFAEQGGKLVSSGALPEGRMYPVSVAIRASAGGKVVYEKFNLNLDQCPDCSFLEYACTCEH